MGTKDGTFRVAGGAGSESQAHTYTHTHTPVLLQLVVDFSGSDSEIQTDRELREEVPIRWPSHPLPPPFPRCHRLFVPDILSLEKQP